MVLANASKPSGSVLELESSLRHSSASWRDVVMLLWESNDTSRSAVGTRGKHFLGLCNRNRYMRTDRQTQSKQRTRILPSWSRLMGWRVNSRPWISRAVSSAISDDQGIEIDTHFTNPSTSWKGKPRFSRDWFIAYCIKRKKVKIKKEHKMFKQTKRVTVMLTISSIDRSSGIRPTKNETNNWKTWITIKWWGGGNVLIRIYRGRKNSFESKVWEGCSTYTHINRYIFYFPSSVVDIDG